MKMLSGMFTSAAAIDAHQQRQELTASNLANLNTPGYRRRVDRFTAPDAQHIPALSVGLDFTPGDVVHTGNRLDLALVNTATHDGNAFFAVSSPTGLEAYTRAGRLSISPEGHLIHTSSGYPLAQPNGAPITLNPEGGEVKVDGKGAVYQGEESIGTVKVVRFGRLDLVRPMDYGLFQAGPGNNVESAEGMVEVKQFSLEMSNANSIEELVNMIANYRSYEASQKILKQTDSSVKNLIRQTTS